MKSKKAIVLTEGFPAKVIILFTLPILGGNMISLFYNMVDSVVVGRFVGTNALAAIGNSLPMLFIMIAILVGLNISVGVVMSQHCGAKNEEMMRISLANSILLSLAFAVVITIIGYNGAEPFLRMMNTPKEVLPVATTYLHICFIACTTQLFYYLFATVYRSMGNSKTALYSLIIANILNIGLDLIFVLRFHWGIAGVAWATAISQLISAVITWFWLQKDYPVLHLHKKDFTIRKDIMGQIFGLALPISLQNSFNAIGSTIIQTAVNGFGTTVIAGYTVATVINQFVNMPMESVGNAMSMYVGQNFGAKKTDRIRQGVRQSVLIALGTCVFIGLFLIVFGGTIARWFVKDAREVVNIVKQYIYIVSVPSFFAGLAYIFEFSLRGLGDGTRPMVAGLIELGVKVAIAMYAAYGLHQVIGIWFAWPVAYILSGLVAMGWYFKKIKNIDQPDFSVSSSFNG